MTITATRGCRVYWNHSVHDLTAGQMIPDGEFATYLQATGAPVVEVDDQDHDCGYPADGTATDALTWVGGDRGRAATAKAAEVAGKQRSGVLTALDKILNA